MAGIEFTVCPDEECAQIAEVSQRFTIPDSEGNPVLHLTIWCLFGHNYTVLPEEAP